MEYSEELKKADNHQKYRWKDYSTRISGRNNDAFEVEYNKQAVQLSIAKSLEKLAFEPTREEVIQKTINEYIGQRQGGKALREFLHENVDEYGCQCDEHQAIWVEKDKAEKLAAKQAKEEIVEPHISTDEMWGNPSKIEDVNRTGDQEYRG